MRKAHLNKQMMQMTLVRTEWRTAPHYPQSHDPKCIKYRDAQDSSRATSPLVQVPEAIVIDTGKYDIDGTREFLLSHLDEEDK